MGKAVSRSTKLMRDGSAIHPSFDFVFDEKLHGPELNSRLKLPANLSPAIKARLLALIKSTFAASSKPMFQSLLMIMNAILTLATLHQ